MNSATLERVLKGIHGTIRLDEPLAPYTSFRIGGPADALIDIPSFAELIKLHARLKCDGIPFFFLGHGSNILVSDAGYRGLVLRAVGELAEIRMENDTLWAGPGARLLDLTLFAAARNLSGMEQLSGIPGSVGGGLYMNAGAYGAEISDGLLETDAVLGDNRLVRLTKAEIGFGYRNAPALQNTIILASRYALKPGDPSVIYAEMRRVWKLRRAKQPLEFPSAGSIFKRPAGHYAGQLIEAVGGKGTRIGGAMVPEKHAGIFVNAGQASAADVAALVREIRTRVWNRFQILLETEVKPVGFEEDPFAIAI
jgi:UDP-N-acetylmuramate dehydrogenase